MRPPGEIRTALRAAFAERGHATWGDVLRDCPVNASCAAEVRLVQHTVENMVRSGELIAVGRQKLAGARGWRRLYELAGAAQGGTAAQDVWAGNVGRSLDALTDVTSCWLADARPP